jgi:hypothetical protein
MYIVTPNIQNPYDSLHHRWMAYPEGSAVEDTAVYAATPEEALQNLLDLSVSAFPVGDVVRVLEDIQAFLGSFRGSEGRVGEAVHLAQLVNNLLVKVAKNVDS